MLKRILFVFVFIVNIPLFSLCCFVSVLIMPIIALFIYMVKGNEGNTLIDFIQGPVTWAINLPYKIMGHD